MNLYNNIVPKQPHRMLLGILDENAYTIMGSLESSTKSFSDLLNGTSLPKSSLYVTLMKLVENGLVIRNGAYFELSDKGTSILKTFKGIIGGRVEPKVLPEVQPEMVQSQQKESVLDKFFNGIKKIFGG